MRSFPRQHLHRISIISLIASGLFNMSSASGADAELAVHNRSGYSMIFALWKNGKDCSAKAVLNPGFNINAAQPQILTIPAEKQIALGVAIFEIQDKLPVTCDYILSFTLKPGAKYTLEYDVRDRRCFGHLYQAVDGVYKLILPGESGLAERISAFGWDQVEPGCEEL